MMKTDVPTRSIDIGDVIVNGVVFNPQNWRGGTVNAEQLPGAVNNLFDELAARHIDYTLVGGIAILQYVEGRNTQDIDFIVPADSIEKLAQLEITGRYDHFARGLFEGLRVDFLFTTHPLFRLVREKYSAPKSFLNREVVCATIEGLLLLKLFALPSLYRQGNLDKVGLYEADIFMLLPRAQGQIDVLFQELKPHLSASDFSEVQKIAAEIRERLQRLNRASER